MPSVLPRKRTSSTSSLSLSPWMCGAMSSAVSSLRLLPSSEKILESDMVSCVYPGFDQRQGFLLWQRCTKSGWTGSVKILWPAAGLDYIMQELMFWWGCVCAPARMDPCMRRCSVRSWAAAKPRRTCESGLRIAKQLPLPLRHHIHTSQWDQDSRVCIAEGLRRKQADGWIAPAPPPPTAANMGADLKTPSTPAKPKV